MNDSPPQTPPDSLSADVPNSPQRRANGGILSAIWKGLTSMWFAVVVLLLSVLLVYFGTVAQKDIGLLEAQKRWFQSWIVTSTPNSKAPIFPGGYLLGTLLLLNLVCAHFRRFRFPPGGIVALLAHYLIIGVLIFAVTYFLLWQPLWYSMVMICVLAGDMLLCAFSGLENLRASGRKIGVDLAHVGIVVMLVGQLITDMTAQESYLSFREGETKRYSESHTDCELAVAADMPDGEKEEVVAIPDSKLLDASAGISHEKFPFTLIVKEWMPHADLMDRDKITEAQATLAQAFATLEAKYSNAESLAEEAAKAGEDQDRSALWWKILDKNGVKREFGEALEKVVKRLEAEPEKLKALQEGLKAEFRGRMLERFERQPGEAGYVAAKIASGDKSAELTPPAQANSPVAERYFLVPQKEQKGMEARNVPGAVVELRSDNKSLGTWIVSPELKPQSFDFRGREWRLSLRFARFYYPFTLTLLKTTHKVYPGTDTPRDFRSKVRLQREATKEDREVDIFMNSPMRLKDERLAFFQHQMGRDEVQANVGTSVLQVVRNPNWFSPYFACALVGYGLLRHFLLHLLRFANRHRAL